MSKRFVDTDIWARADVIDLSMERKLLFIYVITSCSNIGVFSTSLKLASFTLGFTVKEEDLFSLPCDIEKIGKGKYWLPNFCFFQYGHLKETCKPHKRYIEDLKKEGLYERVSKGYAKGIQTLEEKEQEKEKEKEGKKTLPNPPKSLKEVLDYCYQESKMFEFDAWDFYETNEENNWWRKDGSPVKNWKSYLRNWAGQKWAKKVKQQTHGVRVSDYCKSFPKEEYKKAVGLMNEFRKIW